MKFAKVILLTALATLLIVVLFGLLGFIVSALKFFFWVALFVAVLALIVKLVQWLKRPSQPASDYSPRELESWDKMFEDYRQGTKTTGEK